MLRFSVLITGVLVEDTIGLPTSREIFTAGFAGVAAFTTGDTFGEVTDFTAVTGFATSTLRFTGWTDFTVVTGFATSTLRFTGGATLLLEAELLLETDGLCIGELVGLELLLTEGLCDLSDR